MFLASLALGLLITQAACAQSPLSSGLSVGSTASGAPMAQWQQISPNGALVGRMGLMPASSGYTASLAANRSLDHSRWLLDGAFDTESASQLSSRSGHIGMTFAVPGCKTGLLQTTIGLSSYSGNSVVLDNALWPTAGARQSALSAGLRWAPTPLAVLHLNFSFVRGNFPLAEQEIGLNSAFSSAFFFSLGLHMQENVGWGMLGVAAFRWQPHAESAFAMGLESDIARGYSYEPVLNPEFATSTLRRSGQSNFAVLDAPVSPTLTLHLRTSLPLRGLAAQNGPLGPAFLASLSRSL